MRDWRPFHGSITTSDRIRQVSSDAKWLLVMLIAKQDDLARFPWTDANVILLTAPTCPDWDLTKANSLADELATAGLITRHPGYVTVVGGIEKQAKPDKRYERRLYPIDDSEETSRSAPGGARRGDGGAQRDPVDRGDEIKGKEMRLEGEETEVAAALNNQGMKNIDSSLLNELTNACIRDFGPIEPGLARLLKQFAELNIDMPIGWVERAFDEAAKNSAYSWGYVEKVLTTWIDRGQPGPPTKEKRYGKSGQDSSNDANGKHPGSGFGPLTGEQARVG